MIIKDYSKLTISNLHNKLKNKEINSADIHETIAHLLKKYSVLNVLTTELIKPSYTSHFDTLLSGIPYFAKDNINTVNITTTASCKLLENFVPAENAHVINLLNEAGAMLYGKNTMDELGMGGHGLYAATGHVLNPWDTNRITGGSSSGSVAAVAAGIVPFAIATDTGDSIRKPAAFCGVYGLKPTYGLISRNGVIPYAPSLDTVGIISRTVEDLAIVLDTLSVKDKNDLTNVGKLTNHPLKIQKNVEKLRIAIITEINDLLPDKIKTPFDEAVNHLKNGGAIIEEISFPIELLQTLLPIYIIISFSEAASCHANLGGVSFNSNSEPTENLQKLMRKNRTEGLGHVVKRRFIFGAHFLSLEQKEQVETAKKIRNLILQKIETIFESYDAFLLPTDTDIAPTIYEIQNKKEIVALSDDFLENILLLANFSGIPSLSIPIGKYENMPLSLNINTKSFTEEKLLSIAAFLEEKINFKNDIIEGNNE